MTEPLRLYHGGAPGLRPGDLLTGGHRRPTVDGCPTCEARARGLALAAPDGTTIDPPSARPDRLYVTTDRDYARFYASLYGRGDLYRVDPEGQLEPSAEDHFPTWTVPAARVLAAVDRAVLLTPGQRRRMLRRWTEADAAHANVPCSAAHRTHHGPMAPIVTPPPMSVS